MWLLAGSQQPGSFQLTLEKISSNAPDMTHNDSTLLHDYGNKKNILYTTQGLVGDANTNPSPLLRQWFKIPKGKQRFGLGDKLNLNLSSFAENITSCGVIIYKEYY